MPHSPEIVLRDGLVPADRAPLERIIRDSAFFREDEVDVAIELINDGLARGAASEYQFIVAERDGHPLGYCCYGMIACTVHSFDLYWIAVAPSLQRSGIGRRLMDAAEERVRAQGGRRVYVETSSKPLYEPTRQFYLGCGYRIEATLEDFYATGDGKVVMVKALA